MPSHQRHAVAAVPHDRVAPRQHTIQGCKDRVASLVLLGPPMISSSSLPPPPDLSTEPESVDARRSSDDGWAPQEGQWIAGTYRLGPKVGEGGLGIVFSARDVTLDRLVAIKVLRPEMASRPELRGALVQEARRLAGVRHPRIVTVHACGTHRGYPYVVMELVEGTNVLSRLREAKGKLETSEAVRILTAVAEGLTALHTRGIVHGDVKPSNVLLGVGERVKLTDIGMSVGPEEHGALLGTLPYLAPERILGEPAGIPGDIYAFGVTAFQLLTGELPHASQGNAILRDAVCERHRSARSLRPELPMALEAVFDALLAKAPLERPPTATLAVAGIRRALGVGTGSRVARQATSIRRLLIADDDPDLVQMLSIAIASSLRGCAVEGVGTGDDALTSAEHAMPDGVVLDLQMPGRSAPDITRRIRALPGGESIPILVVTGSGSASDWREVRAAGADACLLKPFDVAELVASLERFGAQRSGA